MNQSRHCLPILDGSSHYEGVHRLTGFPSLAKKQPKKDRELRWKATVAALHATLIPQGVFTPAELQIQ